MLVFVQEVSLRACCVRVCVMKGALDWVPLKRLVSLALQIVLQQWGSKGDKGDKGKLNVVHTPAGAAKETAGNPCRHSRNPKPGAQVSRKR